VCDNQHAKWFRPADRYRKSGDEPLLPSECVTGLRGDLEVHERTQLRALKQPDERAPDGCQVECRRKIPGHHFSDQVAVVVEEHRSDLA
jgi:hypothetical protein